MVVEIQIGVAPRPVPPSSTPPLNLGIISETVFVCMCEKMEYREMGKVWVVLYNKEEE